MSPYGPPVAYEGRLADLRGPKWPSRLLPTHVVVEVVEEWSLQQRRLVWRITAYAVKDCAKRKLVWNPTWLPRRCV